MNGAKSRLEVPLLSKKIWATGDLVLRAELDLLIRNENGVWRPETFRVDSATEMTSMAATHVVDSGFVARLFARACNPLPEHQPGNALTTR